MVHPLMPRLHYADYQADPQRARDRVLQAVRLLYDGGGAWREGDNLFRGWSHSPQSSAPRRPPGPVCCASCKEKTVPDLLVVGLDLRTDLKVRVSQRSIRAARQSVQFGP